MGEVTLERGLELRNSICTVIGESRMQGEDILQQKEKPYDEQNFTPGCRQQWAGERIYMQSNNITCHFFLEYQFYLKNVYNKQYII